MSQAGDWGVPSVGPATPTAYAGRDNDSFNALLSGHIGASRPAYVLQGTNWLKDTGASPQVIEEYFFDGTNDILVSTFDVITSKRSFTSFVGSAIASAATIVIPIDGNYFSLTGADTVSTMTVAINRQFTMKSASGLTLTAGAPIVTIDGNDLVLAAGETVTLQSTAANVVQVVSVGSVGGGVGGWDFVESVDVAALATAQNVNAFELGFDYLLKYEAFQSVTDGVTFKLLLGVDASTFRVTNYKGMFKLSFDDGTFNQGQDTVQISPQGILTLGNGADEELSFTLELTNPAAVADTYYEIDKNTGHNSTTTFSEGIAGGHHGTAEGMFFVRSAYSAGNHSKGTIMIYKRART